LRSPSAATFELMMRSARCRGVYACGALNRAAGEVADVVTADASARPHSPQNRCPGGLSAPQPAHRDARRAPQSPQNFCPAGFS
jgi:hypothetical protein